MSLKFEMEVEEIVWASNEDLKVLKNGYYLQLYVGLRSPGNKHRANRGVTTELYTTPKFRYRENEEEAWKWV